MSFLGEIERLAKRSSRRRIRRIHSALIIVLRTGFHTVSLNHFMLVSLERNPPSDMQTLSRMTGKDFSGPVPVIRAKSPPSLEPSNIDTEGAATTVRKQSRTPGPSRPSKEACTEVELARPGVKAAPSTTSQKVKKSANDLSQDDVEVLGTIDGDWD